MERELKIQVKVAPAFEVYNLMQDQRHLLLVDLRTQEQQNETHHVRACFAFGEESVQRADFEKTVQESIARAVNDEAKYKQKKIRRVVFMDTAPIPPDDARLRYMRECLESADKDFRIYVLKEAYETFYNKYPFLCVTEADVRGYQKQNQTQEITESQKKVLYAFSQFPIEVVENEVYLGNVFHCSRSSYIKDLNIKTVIDFSQPKEKDAEEEAEVQRKKQVLDGIDYQRVPLHVQQGVDIDFQDMNQYIQGQVEKGRGPVLFFCSDGKKISPAFAIAYLMYRRTLQMQIASLKVFQYLGGNVDISKWIYAYVAVYRPVQKREQKA